MNQAFNDVLDFMRVARQGFPTRPTAYPLDGEAAEIVEAVAGDLADAAAELKGLGSTPGVAALRARLMAEELAETLRAMLEGDEVAIADGLADLCYVTIGTAVAYGIDLPAVWAEVQRANMAKFHECPRCGGDGWWQPERTREACPDCDGLGRIAVKDASGKVQKPSTWTPPDIAAVLAAQGEIGEPSLTRGRANETVGVVRAAAGNADPTFSITDSGVPLVEFDPATLPEDGSHVEVAYVPEETAPPVIHPIWSEDGTIWFLTFEGESVCLVHLPGKVYPVEAFPILAARWVAATQYKSEDT